MLLQFLVVKDPFQEAVSFGYELFRKILSDICFRRWFKTRWILIIAVLGVVAIFFVFAWHRTCSFWVPTISDT